MKSHLLLAYRWEGASGKQRCTQVTQVLWTLRWVIPPLLRPLPHRCPKAQQLHLPQDRLIPVEGFHNQQTPANGWGLPPARRLRKAPGCPPDLLYEVHCQSMTATLLTVAAGLYRSQHQGPHLAVNSQALSAIRFQQMERDPDEFKLKMYIN